MSKKRTTINMRLGDHISRFLLEPLSRETLGQAGVSLDSPQSVVAGGARVTTKQTSPPACMLLDGTVARRHGLRLRGLVLPGGSRSRRVLVLPGGERAKTMIQLERAYCWLAGLALPRDGVLIGIGGGAILDLAGLVASTWNRGVRYIAIPTTLLAMVDASIGGKTAINVAGLKNPVGTFHPASHILADPAFLTTLPRREWRCGLAELIKTAAIGSGRLFAAIERQSERLQELLGRGPAHHSTPATLAALPWTEWIGRAARVKARVVTADFREAGPRRALNLGHTLGHVLEADGTLTHGEAVAVGMASAARLAARRGLCNQRDALRLINLLVTCGLPVKASPPARDQLARLLGGDKKRQGGKLRWILPERIGRVRLDQEVSVDEITAAMGNS